MYECECCCDTGVLRAYLVKNDQGQNQKITAVVCATHFNFELVEKTLTGMQENTTLEVDAEVEEP